MRDLSIIIPARNEMFLRNTVEDILSHIEADTEIIIVCDGNWPLEPIQDNPRVVMVYHPDSIGQRAAVNEGVRLSNSEYIMKCDAHCSFDQGFDRKLMIRFEDGWTIVPRMYNLHVFDWVCECGARIYQGRTPENCEKCGGQMKREIIWQPRWSRMTDFMRFDHELKFAYWGDFRKRLEAKSDIAPTMSLLGACWMMKRKRYWEIDGLDESIGSWGQMGTEIACKSWLSGGGLFVNKTTWFAHLFRTQGGDFGAPYPLYQSQVDEARKKSRELFFGNAWPKQIHTLEWLINRFAPVPDWDLETKQAIYYTCNTHPLNIELQCRQQLVSCRIPIISVSLNQEIDFGDIRLVERGERSPEMMFRQIVAGLKAATAKYVYLCESDVLYHPTHFDFSPMRNDVFYYNTNVWRVRYSDGFAVWTDDLQQVSGLCGHRTLLLDYFEKKLAQIEGNEFDRHYEPGTKTQTIYPRMRGGKYGSQNYISDMPNICIRHTNNLTRSNWSPKDFRNPEYAKGWKETYWIPGWGKFREFFHD